MLQSLLEIGLVMASSYISTADQWPAVIKLLITASLKSAAAAPDVDSPSAGPVHAGTRGSPRVSRRPQWLKTNSHVWNTTFIRFDRLLLRERQVICE